MNPQQEFLPNGIHLTKSPYSWFTLLRRRIEWKRYAEKIPPYPRAFEGKGIVTCAGGLDYFTCAWTNISLLRKHGCTLPVELWYMEHELTPEITRQLHSLDVTCKKIDDFTDVRITSGFQLKPLAILHSRFREILFLDADNTCIRDPSGLFNSPEYHKTGAVFWPDYWTTASSNPIWTIIGKEPEATTEQESGQLLINKEKCWKALNLCRYFNLHSFYYKILWGDKDTFRFAWMALDQPSYRIPHAVSPVGFRKKELGFCGIAMMQHSVDGAPLFIHSNLLKWNRRTSEKLLWEETICKNPGGKQQLLLKDVAGYEKPFLTLSGDIDCYPTDQSIRSLENEGLNILDQLRTSGFYMTFKQTHHPPPKQSDPLTT